MRHRVLFSACVVCFFAIQASSQMRGSEQATPAGAAGQGGNAGRGAQAPAPREGGPGIGSVGGVGAPPARAAGPAPRHPNGRAMLGTASLKEKGLWLPQQGGATTLVDQATLPLQPWAKAVAEDRQRNQLEPHTRCKPSGSARQFITPYGVEIVEIPELQRVFIFDVGGPHTYRTIYVDGRQHPAGLVPSYYGHSIGRWEGDTLVVDTVGYNDAFWMDRRGTPHTDRMRTVERFTRLDSRTIKYELTVDDPGAYTRPWTAGFNLSWEDDTELFEYVCQQGNYADTLMLGEHASVDRTSTVVP